MSERVELILDVISKASNVKDFDTVRNKVLSLIQAHGKQIDLLEKEKKLQSEIARLTQPSVTGRGQSIGNTKDLARAREELLKVTKQLTNAEIQLAKAENTVNLALRPKTTGGADTRTLLQGLTSYGAYFAIKQVGAVIAD